MEFKISKKRLFVVVGVIAIVAGGTVWASRNNHPVAPYAGVPGADLPAVVGKPSLSGAKIPYAETENYKQYTPEVLQSIRQSGNAVLLYFYADWCTSCWEQEPIHAIFFNNALKAQLPIIGVRINIDDLPPVMREFGMNYSHSYVLLDKNGNVASKFFGTHSEAELMKEVKKVL